MTEHTIDTARPLAREVTPPSRYAADWLRRARDLPRINPATDLGLSAGDHVLMTTSHPDDETFAAGATLAALSQLGVYVHVVCMSAGEAALANLGQEVPGLARRRVEELTAACRALGIEFSLANRPDGELASHAGDMEHVVRRAIATIEPRIVFTLWWGDPHPDHRTVGMVTSQVAAERQLLVSAFPIWAQHWSDPRPSMLEEKFAVMATPRSAQRQRDEAVAAYASQLEPLHGDVDAVLPPWFLEWTTELAVIA
jgi:LmbE family N-acetylglucosaminyl deacetylase